MAPLHFPPFKVVVRLIDDFLLAIPPSAMGSRHEDSATGVSPLCKQPSAGADRAPFPRNTPTPHHWNAPPHRSGRAVPLSRFALISAVYLPNARSIFLLKCALRGLM